MKKILGFLVIALVLAGIAAAAWKFRPGRASGWLGSNAHPVETPAPVPSDFTVTYQARKIASEAGGITIDIEYPEFSFTGVATGTADVINASAKADAEKFQSDFQADAAAYRKDAGSLPPGIPDAYDGYRRFTVAVSKRFGAVSVLYADLRGYAGTAHPMNSFASAAYDLADGSLIAPGKIAADGSLPGLYARFVAALSAKYDLNPSDNYDLTAERLPQFSHFIIEDAGLHMYVDQDAILSHAEGPADVSLPWSGLREVISARFSGK